MSDDGKFYGKLLLGGLALAGLCRFTTRKDRQKAEEEQRRRNTRFNFSGDISEEDFETIVRKAAKKIKRITNVTIEGPIITGSVISQSGLSSWDFTIDFNDYGRLSGKYWITSENDDSDIPTVFARKVAAEIYS